MAHPSLAVGSAVKKAKTPHAASAAVLHPPAASDEETEEV
jgi:hypothetical protein